MTTENDSQAQGILNGLAQLDELLLNPVAINTLELEKNAQAAYQFDILKRIRKSLSQYLERDNSLFYVGMLGHFSAGKSSTINSLLDVWGSSKERKTSLNPTDTTITLITQEKNSPALLGVIREGHVPIRLEKVEAELLQNVVLVDTPGTGDPQFVEEVARDFLPICDVIMFLFSAASPLDKSDVPLLEELHKRLPFIPLHFVVTRSDEFRRNENEPLTEENLDAAKVKAFLDVVTDRVNKILAPRVYQASNFSLIDNKSKFRTNDLASFLTSKCDSSNIQSHVSMHMNKLQFYLNSAKGLKVFFAQVLDTKLVDLNKVVTSASRNIDRYQHVVGISNSNLARVWTEASLSITNTASSTLDSLKVPPALPTSSGSFPSVSARRNETITDMQRDARFHARTFSLSVKSALYAILRDHFYEVSKGISETTLERLSAASHTISPIPVELALRGVHPVKPQNLSTRVRELRMAELTALREAVGDVRRATKNLEDVIEQRIFLKRVDHVLRGAQASLETELSSFFQNVELYRSGVFAHTTKESIAALGIGQKLDALESEFTEEDRAALVAEASGKLFPGASTLTNDANNDSVASIGPVHSLFEETRDLKFEEPSDQQSSIEELLSEEHLKFEKQVLQNAQKNVDEFIGGLNVQLASLLVEARRQFDEKSRNIAQMRRKTSLIVAAATAAAYAAGAWLYHHQGLPGPTSATGQAALNILCGIAVEVIALWTVRLKLSLPKLMKKADEEIQSSLNERVKSLFETSTKEIQFDSLDESVLANQLASIYRKTLDVESDKWKAKADHYLSNARDLFRRFSALRAEHVTRVEFLRSEALRFFSEPKSNIVALNEVASTIKESAIEPSFTLLENTRYELETVKTAVLAVQFD